MTNLYNNNLVNGVKQHIERQNCNLINGLDDNQKKHVQYCIIGCAYLQGHDCHGQARESVETEHYDSIRHIINLGDKVALRQKYLQLAKLETDELVNLNPIINFN